MANATRPNTHAGKATPSGANSVAAVSNTASNTTSTDNVQQIPQLAPQVRLFIKNEDCRRGAIFGKGVADLCRGVEKFGSLNAAAKQMHMAYSKAWRIVKETENDLGVQMLNRDGAHGSTLTPEGTKILDAYFAVSESVQAFAENELDKYLEQK